MANARKTSSISATKIAQITSVVRALCVIYNTSLTYQTTHAVFRKSVEERMALFEAALADMEKLPLMFGEGFIRVDSVALEPGSAMFQRLSQKFEAMGIAGLFLLKGITAEELSKFVRIVTVEADHLASKGLDHFLKRDGIKHILERRMSKQTVEVGSGVARAGEVAQPDRKRVSPVAESIGTWDIEAGDETDVLTMRSANVYSARSFGEFVQGALGALSRNEARLKEVADIISTEFEARLTERVEEVRKTGERRARRLESIQDLLLKELEALKLAAMILDSELSILAANHLAKEIVGDIARLEKDSPLGLFIASRQERQDVEINGKVRSAHLLASTSHETEHAIILISLE